MPRHRPAAILAVLAVGALAACGTQLPDSRFADQPTTITTTETAAAGDQGTTPDQATATQDAAAPTGAAATTTASGGGAAPTGAVAAAPTGGAAAPTVAQGTTKGTTPTKGATTSAAKTTAAGVGKLTASDTGVSATTITLGNLVSAGGITGSEQFGSAAYGVKAYFANLNAHGGINGRKVNLISYNDNGDGSQNTAAVNQAVSTDKVFAMVGTDVFSYAGASILSKAGVPDVGGQPIDNSYYQYPHFYSILGYNGPRNGTSAGYNGTNYGQPNYAFYFKNQLGAKTAGIVYYDQASSAYGASSFQLAFKNAGVANVKLYPVNLGLPNFSNTVAQMQSDGVDVVADAMDANGNAKLCQAMEGNSAFLSQVKAKVSSISAWSQRIPTEFKQTPTCRTKIYSNGTSTPYTNLANPVVKSFNAAMATYQSSKVNLISQWSFEGWLAGELFTEAATACGANLTRTCIEQQYETPGKTYTLGGGSAVISWYERPASDYDGKTNNGCYSIVHWDDPKKTWDTVNDITQCTVSDYYNYKLS